jgi:acyl carrier protein
MVQTQFERPHTTAPELSQEETRDVVLCLWSSLLGRNDIGLDENFFDLGGSSLLLIRLHALLNERYRGRLSLMDLFQATTVQKISDLLEGRSCGDLIFAGNAKEGEEQYAAIQRTDL